MALPMEISFSSRAINLAYEIQLEVQTKGEEICDVFSPGNIPITSIKKSFLKATLKGSVWGHPFSWILFACTCASRQRYFSNNVSQLYIEEQQKAKENLNCLL